MRSVKGLKIAGFTYFDGSLRDLVAQVSILLQSPAVIYQAKRTKRL
jgi:hypothetical protein